MSNKKALDVKTGTIFRPRPSDFTIIGLDTDDGPEHPLFRRRRNEREVSDALIEDIAANGVDLTVVAYREKLLDGTQRLVLIDGRQRVRAAREAEKRHKIEIEVPTLLKDKLSETQRACRSIALDYLRFDEGVAADAEEASRLVNEPHSLEHAAVAGIMGCSLSRVVQLIKFHTLPAAVKAAVEKKKIGFVEAVKKFHGLSAKDAGALLSQELEASEVVKKERTERKTRDASSGKTKKTAAAPAKKEVAAFKLLWDKAEMPGAARKDGLSPASEAFLAGALWARGLVKEEESELAEGLLVDVRQKLLQTAKSNGIEKGGKGRRNQKDLTNNHEEAQP